MSVTPKAIQDLLDELEASKQSRLRAWAVLQRIRAILSESGMVIEQHRKRLLKAKASDWFEKRLVLAIERIKGSLNEVCCSIERLKERLV